MIWPMAFAMPVRCARCRAPIGDADPVELVWTDLVRHRDCPVRYPKAVT